MRIDSQGARVYPEGWQSWTPTRIYGARQRQLAPVDDNHRTIGYRGDCERVTVPGSFLANGLLAVQQDVGEPVQIFSATSPHDVATIRAYVNNDELTVTSRSTVQHWESETTDFDQALGAWGRRCANDFGVKNAFGTPPRVWCSWYQYFGSVRALDIVENLDAIDQHQLDVDVVQIDDGYQSSVGDWLTPSAHFFEGAQGTLRDLVDRILATGRRAGIWLAPFLVGERSRLAHEHPDWLLAGVDAGSNWGQRLLVLDMRMSAVRDHLTDTFASFREIGVDYFKLDFMYAGALRANGISTAAAVRQYRQSLELIREVVGVDSYLVGCGAPILASVGLVDAMRVSPDTAPYIEPVSGDMSSPGQSSAVANSIARQWQNGVFWTNDPDCLLARPGVESREQWAEHVMAVNGLRSFSDRIESLDQWGLDTVRTYLQHA
jgi:alpha-galactosidase